MGVLRPRLPIHEILRAGGTENAGWRLFLARWLLGGLLLVLVAAWASDGFHHPDEQFQVLEFVAAKLGRTSLSELPWEFPARMRPWMQPALYYGAQRTLTAVGIEDPFAWALCFRLLSGLVGWIGLLGLALCSYVWFPEGELRRWVVRLFVLAWFMPYLLVRTSAENLSESSLVLGLALLVLSRRSSGTGAAWPPTGLAAVGFLFGLAFEFRYASGLMAASVVAWAVIIGGLRVSHAAWVAAGALPALVLGAIADRWGYGEWVFPAYHYLAQNLWLGQAGQKFGTAPWYAYLLLPLQHVLAPLIVVQILVTLASWIRHPAHVLTWAAAPYLLVLSLIGHKEVRFLFPIAVLGPAFLGLAATPGGDALGRLLRRLWERRDHWVGRALFALNLGGLATLSLAPNRAEIRFQRFVYDHFPEGVEAFVLTPRSPYGWAPNLQMHFYRPDHLLLRPATQMEQVVGEDLPEFYAITPSFHDAESLASGYDCSALYRSFPPWLRHFDWFGWQARTPSWDLFRCARADRTGR